LGLIDCIRGPLYPEITADFQVSQTIGSLFFASCSAAGFFGGSFGGKLIHAKQTQHALKIGTLFMAMAALIIGLGGSFVAVLCGSFLLGISFGVLNVVENVMVNYYSNTKNRSQLMSGLHAMYGLASFAAPVFVNLVAGQSDNWRTSFLIVAVICFIFLGSIYIFNWKDPAEYLQSQYSKLNFKEYLFCWMLACYVAVELLIMTRLPLYLRSVLGLSMVEANNMTTWFFLLLFLGRLLFALMPIKLFIIYQMMASIFLTVVSIFVGILVTPWGFVLSGFLLAPFYPMAMAFAGASFKKNLPKITGFAVTASSVVIVTMHLAAGVLTDWFGIQIAFMMSALFGSCSLGLLIWLERHE
jgi:fucose permease